MKATERPRPRPDLPAHHPQNVPLSQWSDGWLKLSCSSHLGVGYLTAYDHEKVDRGWPSSAQEMIDFLIERGHVPAAGVR